MLVATHPSDCFDQAGGTLAHHAAKGDRVTVVLATTGVRSHHNRLQEERQKAGADLDVEERVKDAIEQKLEETRNACRILGFEDIRTLGFEDDDILVTQDKIEAIAEAIREIKPDILITHHPYEGGGFKMHATIGQCTLYAWQLAMGVGRGNQIRHYVPYRRVPRSYDGQARRNSRWPYASFEEHGIHFQVPDPKREVRRLKLQAYLLMRILIT